MKEGGEADHIHIRIFFDELAQPLQGEGMGFGLPDIEGQLVFNVTLAIGNIVVHVQDPTGYRRKLTV